MTKLLDVVGQRVSKIPPSGRPFDFGPLPRGEAGDGLVLNWPICWDFLSDNLPDLDPDSELSYEAPESFEIPLDDRIADLFGTED